MRQRRLRRHLQLLQGYVLLNIVGIVVLSAAAFRQTALQKLDELTVQRLNVVDANGTLRMVLANKDRMHPGVLDGVTINRPRPVAGLIFFNDLGDEVGGLTWSGQEMAGQPPHRASSAGGLPRSRRVAPDRQAPRRRRLSVHHIAAHAHPWPRATTGVVSAPPCVEPLSDPSIAVRTSESGYSHPRHE